MTYIILAAGKGGNLYPLTLKHPKPLYKLDAETSVLQRCVRMIRKYDKDAEIVVVIGYMNEFIKNELIPENVKFVNNPFYSLTSSISSLWFAKEYLQRENVVIINGDVVLDEELTKTVVCAHTDVPYVLVDSGIKSERKYNVQVEGGKICVMSNNLSSFFATYASVTKLDAVSSRLLLDEVNQMIKNEMYNLYYEDALIQMIFENSFDLFYKDIKDFHWVEIDNVDDLIKAKRIHKQGQ